MSAEAGVDAASLEALQTSSIDMAASSSDEVEVQDVAKARRNFERINSMQREQLGRAGEPPDATLPGGITADQLFPGEQSNPPAIGTATTSDAGTYV